MPKKKDPAAPYGARWMNECDVIRYNLKIPEDLKEQIKGEASEKDMDMSTYICGLLTGDIKRKKSQKLR
ncbi:MAG: hypothetical protein P8013_11905 [Candidatus Sulfobium sp.]|jgi:hypothetical protein